MVKEFLRLISLILALLHSCYLYLPLKFSSMPSTAHWILNGLVCHDDNKNNKNNEKEPGKRLMTTWMQHSHFSSGRLRFPSSCSHFQPTPIPTPPPLLQSECLRGRGCCVAIVALPSVTRFVCWMNNPPTFYSLVVLKCQLFIYGVEAEEWRSKRRLWIAATTVSALTGKERSC